MENFLTLSHAVAKGYSSADLISILSQRPHAVLAGLDEPIVVSIPADLIPYLDAVVADAGVGSFTELVGEARLRQGRDAAERAIAASADADRNLRASIERGREKRESRNRD